MVRNGLILGNHNCLSSNSINFKLSEQICRQFCSKIKSFQVLIQILSIYRQDKTLRIIFSIKLMLETQIFIEVLSKEIAFISRSLSLYWLIKDKYNYLRRTTLTLKIDEITIKTPGIHIRTKHQNIDSAHC